MIALLLIIRTGSKLCPGRRSLLLHCSLLYRLFHLSLLLLLIFSLLLDGIRLFIDFRLLLPLLLL